MKLKTIPTWLRWISLVCVSTLAAVGIFQLIYATNPLKELAAFIMTTTMRQSIVDKPAPEFVGLESWFNVDAPLAIEQLRGKVVLIDFWTYACVNCQRSAPHIQRMYAKLASRGLTVIGIHTPEFRFERELDNVTRAAEQFGLTYPIALDNDYLTWRAYRNRYWPSVYIIDKQGVVRYYHIGEGDYNQIEAEIKQLLAE